MLRKYYPIIPSFLLKYKFKTNELIKNCRMPVAIFHGDTDEVIPFTASLELQNHFKKQDTLIKLSQQGHIGIIENPGYALEIEKILDD